MAHSGLESIVGKILSDNAIGSEKELSNFLTHSSDTVKQIKRAASSSQWVFFTEQSYDGWYCLQKSAEPIVFDVFYKERGAISWGFTSFENEPEAIASVIVRSGCAAWV